LSRPASLPFSPSRAHALPRFRGAPSPPLAPSRDSNRRGHRAPCIPACTLR
jgi:hypothetical protein